MTRGRYVSLDVLRLVASFQMIQGHTIDALLASELRSGRAFDAWSSIRGLTSLAFLFAAGGSLAVVHRREELSSEHHSGSHKRVVRAFILLGIGYSMKVPIGPLFAGDFAGAWSAFVGVDILQCIGVLLLVVELIRPRSNTPGRLLGVLALLALVASLYAAPIQQMEASMFVETSPWRLLTAYVSARSRFPLLPYAAPFVLGYASYAGFSRLCPSENSLRLPSVLETIAGETLILYVFHVVLLYADFVGVRAFVGPHWSLSASVIAVVAVLAASVGVALAWHGGKRRGILPTHI